MELHQHGAVTGDARLLPNRRDICRPLPPETPILRARECATFENIKNEALSPSDGALPLPLTGVAQSLIVRARIVFLNPQPTPARLPPPRPTPWRQLRGRLRREPPNRAHLRAAGASAHCSHLTGVELLALCGAGRFESDEKQIAPQHPCKPPGGAEAQEHER